MVLRSDLTGAWMCRLSDDGTHWGQKNSEIATKILCHDDFMEFVLQNPVCQKEGKFCEIAEVL